MPNYLHRTSKQYLTSRSPADLDEQEANYIQDPELSAVVGFPSIYWTITGDVVSLMSQGERDAVDAAILAAQVTEEKTGAESLYDLSQAEARALRAMVLLIVDELNSLRTQWRDFQTAVDAAANLGQMKTGVAGLPSLADRTYGQARTVIGNKIQGE